MRVIIGLVVLLFVAGVALVLATDIGNLRAASFGRAFAQTGSTSDSPAKRSTPVEQKTEVERKNYGDWLLLCQSPKTGRNCAVVQQHVSGEAKRFMFAVTFRPGPAGSVEVVLATPLNTSLEPGFILKLDDEKPLQIPFFQCRAQQCIATTSLDAALLSKFLKAKKVTGSFQLATGQDITVSISRNGLANGLKALRG